MENEEREKEITYERTYTKVPEDIKALAQKKCIDYKINLQDFIALSMRFYLDHLENNEDEDNEIDLKEEVKELFNN